jgi:type VI protein secretion system component VasF
MQFSEDDLRDALKRKDPGPEFTRRVMARVSQPATGTKRFEVPRRHGVSAWFVAFRLGPALAAAIAVLLLVGAWIGYQSYQQHEREARVIQLQREAEAKKS